MYGSSRGVIVTAVGYEGGYTPNRRTRGLYGKTGQQRDVRVVFDRSASATSAAHAVREATTRPRACARATTSARSIGRFIFTRPMRRRRLPRPHARCSSASDEGGYGEIRPRSVRPVSSTSPRTITSSTSSSPNATARSTPRREAHGPSFDGAGLAACPARSAGGRVEVIAGPMFAGKTEELLRRVRRAAIAGQRVVFFRTPSNAGGGGRIASHAGLTRRRGPSVQRRDRGSRRVRGPRHRAIDEDQFFGPLLEGVVQDLAARG